MNQLTEALLVRILEALTLKFDDKIILKGGMLLRLLGSQRLTRDIDFVLVSKESRKILIKPIREALQSLNDVTILNEKLNSRGIFIDVRDTKNQIETQIEIAVIKSTHMPPEPVSTLELTKKYALGIRVVAAMAIPEAFSHKIAATIEREVIRDLYDIAQYEPMARFDKETLAQRLKTISIGRSKPIVLSFTEAANKLRDRISGLTDQKLEQELRSSLPADQIVGLHLIIRTAIARLAMQIEALDHTG